MSEKKIQIVIDGKKIDCLEGQTVLEVARENDIEIPYLCYHPDTGVKANCRVCVVEMKDRKGLHTSCSVKVEPGLEITTRSEQIDRARKVNLELLFAQHDESVDHCVLSPGCRMLDMAKEYGANTNRYEDRKVNLPKHSFGPSVEFDGSKCIDCRNCVDVCADQRADFLDVREKGHLHHIDPSDDPEKDCIYCGQCVVHCPTGALSAVSEIEEVERLLADESLTVVFQFAPSIRVSIGEEFGLPHGSIVTGQLSAAIRELEPDEVFDVSVGADITTVEEARELVERIKEGEGLPMFTSCCPGWVKYVEFYRPELIPNLTTVRSPHVLFGGLTKTHWATEQGIDPSRVRVVSIMPCTAKKYEVRRKEVEIDGMAPVDNVLTTRELAQLLRNHNVDLASVEAEEPVSPFSKPTGAGVIYGASGGVMESALRTAYEEITGESLPRLEFEDVRGQQGVKKATVMIGEQEVCVAVANGIGNAVCVLDELAKDPRAYDYVEVMACMGGCIGGGGQPVPVGPRIRQKRADALYVADEGHEIRKAHKSPSIQMVYEKYLTSEGAIRPVCHTTYHQRKKEVFTSKST